MKTRASAQDISEPALRCAMHIGKMIKCKEGSVSQSKAMQSQQEAECPSCKQKKLRDYSISRRAEDPLQPRLSGFVCQLPRGYVRHLRHRHRHHHHHQHRHLCCNIIAALAVNRHDNHFVCTSIAAKCLRIITAIAFTLLASRTGLMRRTGFSWPIPQQEHSWHLKRLRGAGARTSCCTPQPGQLPHAAGAHCRDLV